MKSTAYSQPFPISCSFSPLAPAQRRLRRLVLIYINAVAHLIGPNLRVNFKLVHQARVRPAHNPKIHPAESDRLKLGQDRPAPTVRRPRKFPRRTASIYATTSYGRFVPEQTGKRPAVLIVTTEKALPSLAAELARKGSVVLSMRPRGLPLKRETRPLIGDGVSFHRAMLIGRNLPGRRTLDVLRALELLVTREDVDPVRVAGAARGTAGIWLPMATAVDPRLTRIWIDKTPATFRTAMASPLHRNLHDAVIPRFLLRGDLPDMVKPAGETKLLWTDPTNWTGQTIPISGPFLYRTFDQTDEQFVNELIR